MFKYLVNFLLFVSFSSFSYAGLHTGAIKSCSQQSDWEKQKHKVHLEFTLDGEENKLYSMLINLSIEEMIEFTAEEGIPLTIIDELPDTLVGQSLFQLQMEEDALVYEGKGLSIDLKAEAWGVDENNFMVTEVSLPRVILNSKESIHVTSITGDLLGKVFSRYAAEHFIPNKPGISIFVHYSQDHESWFMYDASSKDSHWSPSPEQIASVRTVTSMYIPTSPKHGPFNVFLSGGIAVSFASYPPVKVGNRWIQIEGGWVDLDAAKIFIPSGSHKIVSKIRDVLKTWE